MEFTAKTILSLVDLSQASTNVLRWTKLLAERFSSEVKVVHVMWPPVPRTVTEAQRNQLLEEFEERGEELRRTLHAQADAVFGRDLRYAVSIAIDHPVKGALAAIGELQPALVVLGSHGDDGMARSLMGSVAENVVRESPVPVLVVKGADLAPAQRQLQRVLCPVELSKSAADALDISAGLAHAFGAALEVLRVVPAKTTNLDSELAALRQWSTPVVRKRCPVAETAHAGDTAEEIVLFARQRDVDLIVLGTELRRFLEFSVLGRTAERVVRHGPCSVLLLRLQPQSN